MEQHEKVAQRAASVSLGFNVLQTIVKLACAYFTGSVSVLSEGLHSLSDVLSSFISFVSIRAAAQPPDEEHPYGHGKIDTLAGLSEAITLFLFAGYTAFISASHFWKKPEIHRIDVGLWVVSACAVVAFAVFLYMKKAAKETQSFALLSNAQHLQVDIVTSAGVVLALVVTKMTGWQYADAGFGLGFSLWLAFSAVKMIHKSFHAVIDHKIDPEEMDKIVEILNSEPDLLSYHKLRTRHSGAMHYVDVHIVVPRPWTVVQGHELADRVEKAIQIALDPAICTVHVDPSDN